MVKSVGMTPEGDGTALAQTRQHLSAPEWNFSPIARPKTKRVGTPHPEKEQQALKRAGLEFGSEVSKAKKRMIFEMVDFLHAELHGEVKGLPENEQAFVGEMLSSLAQMAKERSVSACEVEGTDCEGVAGMSPAAAGRNVGEPRKEMELVNHLHVDGTRQHVDPKLGGGVACEEVEACDPQKENRPKATLHRQGKVGPFVENANLNSNVTSCATHPPSPHLGLDECEGDRTSVPQPPESSPEKRVPPANAWMAPRGSLNHGGSGSVKGASASASHRKAEPISLDAGKTKPLGTAGCYEGTPSLSFTDLETDYLSEKLGLAIVGKFSHSLPSTSQIQKSLSGMGLVGAFTWKHLNAKHILLQFQEVADYAKVLNGPNGSPNWYIDVHPMRVFKWAPDFDTFFESSIVAVWCNVVGIPAHLFEESALMAIGNLLGKPLLADHATIHQSRLSFARICVEIDISAPPPEEIILNIRGKESRYKVAWDRIPLFCANCNHVGHEKDDCHASGRKDRGGGKDRQVPIKAFHASLVSKINRQEWRPKVNIRADTSPITGHLNKDKDSNNQAKSLEGAMDVEPVKARVARRSQPSVDEDGFQLVSRKRKGKVHEGVVHIKAQHIDNWHLKENVATVTFGIDESGTNEPGSMSVACGIPNPEMEGFIEDLDPGGCVPCGGIPIAGLN